MTIFISQGGSDQAAAASLDKVVSVGCYLLETLLLHFFSAVRRTEKEEDNVGRWSGAHTNWYYRIICSMLENIMHIEL